MQIRIEGARSVVIVHSKGSRMKKIESSPDLLENRIYLLGRAEEEEIIEKLSNLQSLRYLRALFQKYVDFNPLACNYAKKSEPFLEDSLILASVRVE